MHNKIRRIVISFALLTLPGVAVSAPGDPVIKQESRLPPTITRKIKLAHVVRGRVTYADGRPAGGVEVRAAEKDLRAENALGQAITNPDGSYSISYKPERASVDLIVRVFDTKKNPRAESPVRFGAGERETIDLIMAVAVSAPGAPVIKQESRLPMQKK